MGKLLEGLKKLGSKIRRKRREEDIPQESLAKSVGIAQSYLAEIEAGKKFPSIPVFDKLIDTLDLDKKEVFQYYLEAKNEKAIAPSSSSGLIQPHTTVEIKNPSTVTMKNLSSVTIKNPSKRKS